MITASGIPYNEHSSLVETIVSLKKGKYRFPGVDPEDVAQDIRVICWEALSRFDPTKVGKSIFHYVAKCVDNRLYNQFRGIYLDNNPPCLRCPEWDKRNKTCKINEEGCDRIVQYRERMARRRAIAAPSSYSSLDADGEAINENLAIPNSLTVGSVTGVSDLSDQFRASISEELRPYYDLMVNGKTEEVPVEFVRLIQIQVRASISQSEEE